MSAVLDDRQLRFVRKPRIAVLATVRPDGSPHVTPVWYRYDEAGDFLVMVDRGSQKQRNIERDPRVELCIDDRERPPYHTVIVRGRALIEVEPPSFEDRLALAVRYLGESAGRRYVDTIQRSDQLLIRITPRQIVGW